MDSNCISYESISLSNTSNQPGTSSNKPNLEFTLGRSHWARALNQKDLSYCAESDTLKISERKKKEKERNSEKERKKRRQKRQKAKRKKKTSEKACPYQAVKAQANILYVNMISNYHFQMLHHPQRERGGSSHPEKSIETILGNCIGALILSNFRFWQKGWGLFLHSFAWSRAHFEILFRQRKRKELGPKRAGGWREI